MQRHRCDDPDLKPHTRSTFKGTSPQWTLAPCQIAHRNLAYFIHIVSIGAQWANPKIRTVQRLGLRSKHVSTETPVQGMGRFL
ncbi:unnamed protein product, partial [Iphiclides podalirius]